jgi:hypothetical protein
MQRKRPYKSRVKENAKSLELCTTGMEGHTTNDGQRNIDININHRVPKMEGQMTIARSESMTAIQEHLKNVVIPVLYDDATQGLDQKGTCTLIDVGHDIYLLSAQHVFEGVHHERLKIPANVYGPNLIEAQISSV